MKKRLVKISLAILLAFSLSAQAVTFTSDANIQTGDTYNGVSIYDTPPNHTTVTMTGGTVHDSMNVCNASTLNMSGGNVNGLNAFGQSMVNISGGSIGGVTVYDNATVTVSQNASLYTVGVGYDSIEVVGDYSSIFNMNGGTITYLGAVDSSILNLSGGTITGSLGSTSLSATINIFGYNLVKTASGGTLGDGQVSGFWLDGMPFIINLHNSDTYTCINLIPEPTTLLLLVMGIPIISGLRKSR